MTKAPADHHTTHIWCLEPRVVCDNNPKTGVLSAQGLTNIAQHQYQPGTYTALDLALNPLWTQLAEWLPLWLAPNTVTALGGALCLVSYLLTAQFNFDYMQSIPNWVLAVNGICLIVYYTLDCMDGKQARRTKSSSPLGQLFDHGVDCLANLSHLSLMQSILGLSTTNTTTATCCQFQWLQVSLQLGFFQAQWEEYYTGRLPHAAGNLGTTEVLYGMGLWSLLTGVGVLSREVYGQRVELPLVTAVVSQIPGRQWIVGVKDNNDNDGYEVRDVILLFWVYGFFALSLLSFLRVAKHCGCGRVLASAISKLASPILVAAMILGCPPLSSERGGVRYPSFVFGIVLCTLTIKLVVFGMARMPYATLQLDVLFWMGVVWIYGTRTEEPPNWLFPVATLVSLLRLEWWTSVACQQLCTKLGIPLFSIRKRAAE